MNDKAPIRVLHLEDDPNDVELVRTALDADSLSATIEVVSTRAAFKEALSKHTFDLVLADHHLPGFDGTEALEIAAKWKPSVPFIVVSGQIGEEAAVECVRKGATDYVLKQRLFRLAPAVRRALAEGEERRRRQEAEEALRKSEEQLRQAQKMEAIGRLAGGVAHDFNNLLTVVIGYAQLIQARGVSGPRTHQDIGEILTVGERGAALTRQLLAFSRQQTLQPRVLDLNVSLFEMEKMLRRIIGADIRLVTLPKEDVGRVKADAGQIEQVILNLAVNSRDAMPSGGTIVIETDNVDVQTDPIGTANGAVPGAYVLLTVRDNGCGMTTEVLSHVFEPFYTTKPPGEGTGLGLATVHGIVHQSGGFIEVESKVDKGTSFRIFLPRCEESLVDKKRETPAEPVPGGNERILVIEDESYVRRVVAESLLQAGYEVSEALTRDEAVTLIRGSNERGTAIDLILSDIVLPGMGAEEFSELLSGLAQPPRLLFMSGYLGVATARRGGIPLDAPVLQKPFSVGDLLRSVREALDRTVPKAA